MPVVAAVAFGEHGNVVVAVEALFEVLSEACVHARILVDGNAAGAVQNPAEHGSFPEACLCHECRRRNGMPNDVDVQKALVVSDDDKTSFLRDIFGPFNRDLDSEQLENDVPERKCTDLGTIFPMAAKTTVKGVGDARDEHNGENDDVIKKG